jgi:hypothetical protein
LYPILIAAASHLGIEHADAAFVITGIAYGLVLLVAYHLARTLYDERVAMLSVGALLVYGPMFFIARVAGTEPVGILWVLVSLLLLVRFRNTAEEPHRMAACFLCGMTIGLAFVTRYALLVSLPLALLFLAIESRGLGKALRNLGLCLVGFCLPALPVLAHNFAATGSFASGSLPSDLGFATNLQDALSAVFGSSPLFGEAGPIPIDPTTQLVLALSISLAIGIFLLARRRFGELWKILIENGRWLLLAWSLGYLCFLLCWRTLFHFDRLSARLISPAAVTLMILAIAIMVRALRGTQRKWPFYLTFVLLAVAVGREIFVVYLLPADSDELRAARSERLRWIEQHITHDDLIIGTDVVDVVFYLGRPAAVSFSEYPYTEYLQYEKLVSYIRRNCADYDHFYLIVRDHTWLEGDLGYRFGGFVSDLLAGNLDAYPDILFLTRTDEGPVFRMLTCELGKSGAENVARLNEPCPEVSPEQVEGLVEGACP